MVDPATPHRAEQAPPLHGVTILDLTRLLPGAYATLLLADLGADVIKIESPDKGDYARDWGPPFAHGTSTLAGVPGDGGSSPRNSAS